MAKLQQRQVRVCLSMKIAGMEATTVERDQQSSGGRVLGCDTTEPRSSDFYRDPLDRSVVWRHETSYLQWACRFHRTDM
ncbi:hypothetical protein [Rhodococcoides fascians]|uniref:hypothetical protein n=1 Tax=Rhodococcoides fascians TaxID=1828 RepID=UPI001E511A22|nr:hypothetical protein [Rhodococcus fascians]